MFKENKIGPGRPSNHLPSTTFSLSTGTPDHINSTNQIPQFNTSINQSSIPQMKTDTPHPIASSSYSFPQDYSRLPQPTSQQQYAFPSMYTNSRPQFSTGAPQIPLQQQQQNAAFLPPPQHQPSQQQPSYFRPGQQVRLALPNGNNNIDGEGNEDEDDREWCFCGEHSYGDMICCENPNVSLLLLFFAM